MYLAAISSGYVLKYETLLYSTLFTTMIAFIYYPQLKHLFSVLFIEL